MQRAAAAAAADLSWARFLIITHLHLAGYKRLVQANEAEHWQSVHAQRRPVGVSVNKGARWSPMAPMAHRRAPEPL